MKHHARPLCALLAPALLAGAGALPQPVAPPEKRQAPPVRVLIDRSLQETPVRLLRMTASEITFTPLSEPADAPARTRPLREFLAIVPPAGATVAARPVSREAAPLVAVVTSDGQRLVGHVRAPAENDAKAAESGPPLILESPSAGRFALPLDAVSSVELIETLDDTPVPPGSDDTVVLTNGDRIDGFVDSIGTTVIARPKGAGADVQFPLGRTRRIMLANRSTPAGGTILWLTDGSVIALDGPPESDGQALKGRLRQNHSAFSTPLSSVTALSLDARQVRPLGALKQAGYTAAAERRWSRPPRTLDAQSAPLGAADVEIPGPMSVEWLLPPGALRLAGTAELARSTQGWGDCEVIIEDLSQGAPPRRLFSKRLNVQAPATRFDVAFTPSGSAEHRLRVTVESGPRGPIQDKVYLRRPLLLVN
jgi:hypothetical protein